MEAIYWAVDGLFMCKVTTFTFLCTVVVALHYLLLVSTVNVCYLTGILLVFIYFVVVCVRVF